MDPGSARVQFTSSGLQAHTTTFRLLTQILILASTLPTEASQTLNHYIDLWWVFCSGRLKGHMPVLLTDTSLLGDLEP